MIKYLAVQLNQFVAITLSSTKSEKTPLSTGNFSFITLMLQLQHRSNVCICILTFVLTALACAPFEQFYGTQPGQSQPN
jgi:hypothetical protein